MANPIKFRVNIIEFSAQPVELGNDFLDFQHYRAGYPQIAGAVLARNGLIPDGFGAEGALHQTNRYFLFRLSSSSARLAFDNSSRAASQAPLPWGFRSGFTYETLYYQDSNRKFT